MYKYLPLSYLFSSRILTPAERISWFIIFPFFHFSIIYLFNVNLIHFMILFFGIMSVYEIGYLYNDFITVKNEKNPTIRNCLKDGFTENNFNKIKNYRFGISIFLILIEIIYFHSYFLLLFTFLIIVAYYFHNTLRSRLNIISYFFLVSFRYIAPISFIQDINLFLFIIIVFPILRTLEHACKLKYKLNLLQELIGDLDRFRIIYLSGLTFICLSLYIFDMININYLLLSLYFLIFRFMAYLVRNKVKRQKKISHKE